MPEDKKKKRELVILQKAYPENDYPTVSFSEKPDFILGDGDDKFGVEVTEFYTSGSTARIKNVPNYLQELISDSKFRHKDDIKTLKVETFQVYDKDGNKKDDVRGVFMESMSPRERMDILSTMIAEKDRKQSDYDTSLHHIDLLIYDADNLFGITDKNIVAQTLMSHIDPALIEKTGFNDILIVSQNDEQEYVLSVIENVFMAHIMSAVGFAQNCKQQVDAVIKDDRAIAGVDFMEAVLRHNGFTTTEPVYYAQSPQATKRKALLFRNTVVCADEQGFNIYDFGASKPTGLTPRSSTLPDGLPSKLVPTYEGFKGNYGWVSSVYRRERKLPPINGAKPRRGGATNA